MHSTWHLSVIKCWLIRIQLWIIKLFENPFSINLLSCIILFIIHIIHIIRKHYDYGLYSKYLWLILLYCTRRSLHTSCVAPTSCVHSDCEFALLYTRRMCMCRCRCAWSWRWRQWCACWARSPSRACSRSSCATTRPRPRPSRAPRRARAPPRRLQMRLLPTRLLTPRHTPLIL